jgi:hypothetical protein
MDVERIADVAHREAFKAKLPMNQLPHHLKQLVYQARLRDVNLQIMPQTFERRKCNTTTYSARDRLMHWHIEWIFHADDGHKICEEKVCENRKIEQVGACFRP